MIIEGSARLNIRAPQKNEINKKLEVFYNPVMKFNRDLTLLLLHALGRKKVTVGLPLEASGVRAIRMLTELPPEMIAHISCNDLSETAYKKMQEHVQINNIDAHKISLTQKDSDLFFEESSGFDYIDIDPFGSPAPFLSAAIKRLSRHGILAVTATDTAALTGTYEHATIRKYWAHPLRNELMHEIGVRILIRYVQLLGTIYDKALTPIYSYTKDHYDRVFFMCEKGKTKVDVILAQHEYLLYDKDKMKISRASLPKQSTNVLYAGPLWTGSLWDGKIAHKIAQNALHIELAQEEKKFVETIAEESKISVLGFIDLHAFAKRFKILPRTAEVIEILQGKNIPVARSHFSLYGLRTKISGDELYRLVKK